MFPAAVRSPPVELHALLTAWQTDPLALVALAVDLGVAAWYVMAVRRLAGRGRQWSRWRTLAFLGGLAVVVVAVNSGVASYDDSVFSVHVVQHLLLMSTAPPLLALGAPVTLALQAGKRPTTTRLLWILHSVPVRVISHPAVALGLATVTMYAYFLTPIYRFSLAHPLFHDYTHLHFLVAGCLYWWPLVGLDPMANRIGYPARMALLGVAIPFNTFLGIAIMNQSQPIAAAHTLADTHTGGALLWGLGELFTLAALAIIFVAWMHADEREAARADRGATRDPRRTSFWEASFGPGGPPVLGGEPPTRATDTKADVKALGDG